MRLNIRSMDDRDLEKYLRDALKRLGVKIRTEQLEDGSGGFCRLDTEPLIVIPPSLERSKRIEIFLGALRKMDTSGIFLPPFIREQLEDETDDI
ncbi:MAG TPA: hypothetical protein ENN67_08595 [Firmicutes bacterium]|nr:hypothetical protein [Bacillota bacterium]